MHIGSGKSSTTHAGVVAICGNPNSGKTTIFNAITGLSQKVGNYPGVTVEKVSGSFSVPDNPQVRYELIDVPGTYSLAAFSPDEYIAASSLYGRVKGVRSPDVLICVVDATNLERGLYLMLQVMQVGCPIVVALNMTDIIAKRGVNIDAEALSRAIGGFPVVPVVGNRGKGIDRLKEEAVRLVREPINPPELRFDDLTENLLDRLMECCDGYRTRAEYLRIVFDLNGPAEKEFLAEAAGNCCNPNAPAELLEDGRQRIKARFGSLSVAETTRLTEKASEIYREVVRESSTPYKTRSEKIDRYLLHPVLGPLLLVAMMTVVFQSVFSWSEPFMNLIDGAFGLLAGYLGSVMEPGPFRSLITDGVVGGVGSVLIFLPQIIVLFVFIALLEDSGYMARAAFLVDRMFRWCGLSGKSFIPMLSSFACSVPGIMATRTIEDRKLRFITIMVAPLMPCSARLPVYAIMIAAFIPATKYIGFVNLQGIVLTALYLMGVVVAVLVSFVLQKTVFKTERGTFIMEMPSYKIPTVKTVALRVINRAKSFVLRAGTVIFAITVIIWALSYFPRSPQIMAEYDASDGEISARYDPAEQAARDRIAELFSGSEISPDALMGELAGAESAAEVRNLVLTGPDGGALDSDMAEAVRALRVLQIERADQMTTVNNLRAGAMIRESYLGRFGRTLEPLFEPLGWDWRITMSVLSAFPAREVIIATLGTIYNLGTHVDAESSSLVSKMRAATWDSGARKGAPVFTVAVSLSIMVFFALCCQCGATLVTIKHETGSWGYPIFVFSYMTVLAYVSAFVVFQIFSRAGF